MSPFWPLTMRWVFSLTGPLQPERINPELNQKGYNVKSDVWSLGITMVTACSRAPPLLVWGGGLGVPWPSGSF